MCLVFWPFKANRDSTLQHEAPQTSLTKSDIWQEPVVRRWVLPSCMIDSANTPTKHHENLCQKGVALAVQRMVSDEGTAQKGIRTPNG
jgi:hypothetical protein